MSVLKTCPECGGALLNGTDYFGRDVQFCENHPHRTSFERTYGNEYYFTANKCRFQQLIIKNTKT